LKVIIFGSTGPTGRELIRQALELGHDVTAFARKSSAITWKNPHLTVLQGDVLDPACVSNAVAGHDAVICAIGVRARGPVTLFSDGTKNILLAMTEHQIRRFICLSSAGVYGSDGGFFFGHIIAPLFLENIFDDKRRQIDAIYKSGLDWVIVRAVQLVNEPPNGKIQVNFERPATLKIPRADVAAFMLDQITRDQYLGMLPIISL
jgi:putative NADH-flavin reductase